ncbi:hypothetical protein G647_05546 [Cladophialophora carrionii CBS 160.54]|uniref:Uncharacterized protein n=1 Tax=Cladophialophora carrionii CBS 160.54 TaxID=1279043 RepID=V9DAL2_9EURO|nr:uncharacterized protein G647_05546 [Cladophialophora carrionii CBS 160.54]ETI23741.1 hypothetical protein G647_05546 [Cladophialophora carrionii CBS 160.54]
MAFTPLGDPPSAEKEIGQRKTAPLRLAIGRRVKAQSRLAGRGFFALPLIEADSPPSCLEYKVWATEAREHLININILDDHTSLITSNRINYVTPRAMLNATSVLFTAAHAAMVRSFLWRAGAADTAGSTVQGSLIIPTVRLVVVDSIANVLLGALAVLAVLTVWIRIDVINNETSLFEEPKALLGSAILLHGSDVNAFASHLRRDPEAAQDGRVLAHARRPRRLWGRNLLWSVYRDDVLKKKWKVENWDAPSDTKIVAG